MLHKNNERGSVFVVVSVILVLLFVGVLGYVYYQNINKPKVAEQSRNQMVLSKSIDTTFKDWTISMKYPDSWSAKASTAHTETGAGTNTLTISSKNDAVQVVVTMWAAPQIGGICTNGKAVIKLLNRSDLSGLNTLRFEESIVQYAKTDTESETFVLQSGLARKTQASDTAVVGGDSCRTIRGDNNEHFTKTGDLTSNFLSEEQWNAVVYSKVEIKVTALRADDGTAKSISSEDTLRQAIANEDYKTAVRIVQSYSQK